MSIRHDHTLNSVTALAFLTSSVGTLIILAGEGCFMKAFDAVTSKLICQCRVFSDQTIHGVFVQDGDHQHNDLQVVIWGGSSLILLSRSLLEKIISQEVSSIEELEVRTSDWILDVATSPYEIESCVLITAHNTLLRASLETESHAVSLDTLGSPSRSILYSAHLAWTAPNCVLVAAGTVFGEIIMWEWSKVRSLPDCQVITVFTGHEGSIFGVNISPAIPIGPTTTTRLLASCSDDRTIRVWDIYGRTKLPRITASSETATFPENSPEENRRSDDEEPPSQCIATVMGHASRIWRVKFRVNILENSSGSAVDIISFGEDATAQHWSLSLKKGHDMHFPTEEPCHQHLRFEKGWGPMELVHLNTFAHHSGKQIWQAAMYQILGSPTLLATGGADGKVSFFYLPPFACTNCASAETANVFDLDNPLLSPPTQSSSWDIDSLVAELPVKLAITDAVEHIQQQPPQQLEVAPLDGKPKKKPKMKKLPVDSFNRYTFVSSSHLLMTTTFGRVFLGHIDVNVTWKELHLPQASHDDLKSYSVVKGGKGIALLAGSNGNLLFYRTGAHIQMVAQVQGKVADIFLVDEEKANFIVTTLGAKSAILLKLQFEDHHKPPERTAFDLPPKFIVTSACATDAGDNEILILGSRNGSFAIYDRRSDGSQGATPVLPLTIWNSDQPQGDAITSISPLPTSSGNAIIYYLTTSRNGLYSIFASAAISNGAHLLSVSFYPVHHGTPPLGPNLESAWIEDGNIILSGFRSKNFIVWNETRQYEIANVECGGAHRSYAYSSIEYGRGCFIYTKGSKLSIHSHYGPSHHIIKPGGHGREIKSCAISTDRRLIATGAEDTNIRIWAYADDSTPFQFDCKVVMQKHSAGIQHLQWHGARYLFSSGGNEEFFIWAIEDIPGFGIGFVSEASCPEQSDERDLRIMSFDVTEMENSSGTAATELVVSLAYSDSTFRIYLYSKADKFTLVAAGRYTSSCLMQIKHLQLSKQNLSLLTAATDGCLVLWNISILTPSQDCTQNSNLTQISSHKLHQSTIKCLDFVTNNTQNSIIVVTGGDDNALGITTYASQNLSMKPKSILLYSAHAAAITGLSILPTSGSEREDKMRIMTSSNDQRVKEWEFAVKSNELKKVGDKFTSVADVGDLAVVRDGETLVKGSKKVLVVGNGMEVFTVSC